jgi:mercuric ion transport protein
VKVEILYIADCPHHGPTAERVSEVLQVSGMPAVVEEIEVQSSTDAERLRFIGSPSVRVNGLDVETEARSVQHFGLGCRSYAEAGRRSGLPSKELIWRALQENAKADSGHSPMPPSGQGLVKPKETQTGVLVAGGVAAVLASSCCLGPLLLVTLGFSGAWIGNLSRLEPYRPLFIGAALITLLFAGRRIFRSPGACKPGEVCPLPDTRRAYKVLFGMVASLVAVALVYPYVARFFY